MYYGGALSGFFPLQLETRFRGLPVRTLTSWRHPHCMLCVPVVRANVAPHVLNAFLDWMRTRASVVELTHLVAEGRLYPRRTAPRERCQDSHQFDTERRAARPAAAGKAAAGSRGGEACRAAHARGAAALDRRVPGAGSERLEGTAGQRARLQRGEPAFREGALHAGVRARAAHHRVAIAADLRGELALAAIPLLRFTKRVLRRLGCRALVRTIPSVNPA